RLPEALSTAAHVDYSDLVARNPPPPGPAVEQRYQGLVAVWNHGPADAPALNRPIECLRVAVGDVRIIDHQSVAVHVAAAVDIGPDARENQWAAHRIAVQDRLRAELRRDF